MGRIAAALVVITLVAGAAGAQTPPRTLLPPHLDGACFEYDTVNHIYLAAPCKPVPEPNAKLFHVLIAGAMALQGADAMQTAYIKGAGLGHELNPILQPFEDHPALFGAVKLGSAAVIDWLLIKLHADPKNRWVAVALLVEQYAVQTWCVVHNQQVLNGRR